MSMSGVGDAVNRLILCPSILACVVVPRYLLQRKVKNLVIALTRRHRRI